MAFDPSTVRLRQDDTSSGFDPSKVKLRKPNEELVAPAVSPTGFDPSTVKLRTPVKEATTPQSFMEGFTLPFTEYPKNVKEEAKKSLALGKEATYDILRADKPLIAPVRALGVLELLGADLGLVFSPLTAGIKSFLGDPAERALKGQGVNVAGLGEKVGEYGSLATQMFYGTPLLKPAEQTIRSLAEKQPVDAIKAILAPTSRDVSAERSALIIRAREGQLARNKEQALARLEASRKELATLPQGSIDAAGNITPGSQLDFINSIETGNITSLSPGLQTAANDIRALLDFWRDKAQEIAPLSNVIQNYFPHIWKNGGQLPASVEDAARFEFYNAGRKMYGSKAFRKERTIGSTAEGIARGLEPVSYNPLDLTMIKINEMQRYYYGNMILRDLKKTGDVKFFKNAAAAGPNRIALSKPEFRVFAPPSLAEHFMSFDQPMRDGLQRLAGYLGIDIKMPIIDKILKREGARGYTQRGVDQVVARFGTDDGVLQHEIGHQLDFRYKLANYFEKDKQAWKELGKLAELRDPGSTGSYLKYLLEPTERIANLFNAYWHAPQLLAQVAPTALARLEKFLNSAGEIGQIIRDIKPGVQRGQESVFESGIGPQYVGQYYATEKAYTILNNYLSKGFRGNSLYDVVKSAGNALNQLQLALPGFHAVMVSIDTITSEMARAMDQAYNREFGRAALTALKSPFGVISSFRKGQEVRMAYRVPESATPEMKKLADALAAGGGRIKMDEFYKASGSGNYIKSWKDGTFVKDVLGDLRNTPFQAFYNIVATSLDLLAYPVMDVLVPNVKLGVHAKLMEDFIRRNPNAKQYQTLEASAKMWDSVDNRLGQMVYDNLFWHKTLKDLSFMSVRSVGWNLGTIRELGGGIVDINKFAMDALTGKEPQLTYRMAYSMSLPIVVGTMGAMMTYMLTGHGPQTYMDYFFPPTGGTTPKGAPERVNIPSYMKDVFEYYNDPGQTLINKAHPMFSVLNQMAKNRDYYGAMIADPLDAQNNPDKYLLDWGKYIGKQFTPFAIQGYERLKQQQTAEQKLTPLSSLLGFGPAPASITDPYYGLKYKVQEEKRARKGKAKREALEQKK